MRYTWARFCLFGLAVAALLATAGIQGIPVYTSVYDGNAPLGHSFILGIVGPMLGFPNGVPGPVGPGMYLVTNSSLYSTRLYSNASTVTLLPQRPYPQVTMPNIVGVPDVVAAAGPDKLWFSGPPLGPQPPFGVLTGYLPLNATVVSKQAILNADTSPFSPRPNSLAVDGNGNRYMSAGSIYPLTDSGVVGQ